MSCQWTVSKLPVNCQWAVNGLSVSCQWVGYDMSVSCQCTIKGLSVSRLWAGYDLSVSCPELSASCQWTVTEMLLSCHWRFCFVSYAFSKPGIWLQPLHIQFCFQHWDYFDYASFNIGNEHILVIIIHVRTYTYVMFQRKWILQILKAQFAY